MARVITLLGRTTTELVRAVARGEDVDDVPELEGVFLPIEYVDASGRARCRECGRRIERGVSCVRFSLDLYRARFGRWGNTVAAYVHVQCPDQEGES